MSQNQSSPQENKKTGIIFIFVLAVLGILLYVAMWKFPERRLELGMIGGFILFAVLLWKILSWYLNADSYEQRKDFIDVHAKILGGAALIVSLLFTWQGIKLNQKTSEDSQRLSYLTLRETQKRQMSERMARALEQLSNEKGKSRVGAIYALGQIAEESLAESAKDSNANDLIEYYWPIMQILASWVRENAPWNEEKPRLANQIPADIQAAMDVLGWRKRAYQKGEERRLELHGADLRGLILKGGASLAGAQLWETHLDEAWLTKINLQDAILSNARLRDAYLSEANLEGAALDGADLHNADLTFAKIEPGQVIAAHNFECAKYSGDFRILLETYLNNEKSPDVVEALERYKNRGSNCRAASK